MAVGTCVGPAAFAGRPAFSSIAAIIASYCITLVVGAAGILMLVEAVSGRARLRVAARRPGSPNPLQEALDRGKTDAVEIVADAAWDAPEFDDDAMALLLRIGPGRFAYVNTHWLYDVSTNEGKRVPARIILRFIHKGETLLDVTGEGDSLDIRDDLPDAEWGHYQDLLREHVEWTDNFTELDEAQLPEDWIPIVQRP